MLKRILSVVALAAILATAAGCASLSLEQIKGANATRGFLDDAARVYGLRRPGLVIGDHVPGVAAHYHRATFYVGSRTVDAWWRDPLLAHEVAHWLLDHDAPLRAIDGPGRHREQYARELAAHVKAVEVLVRVKGSTERQALSALHGYLMSVKAAHEKTPGFVMPMGHEPGCREPEDLLRAFPQHRDWTWRLACSPWGSGGQARQ